MLCKRQGKSPLKLDPSCFNLELFFVRTHMYVRTQKYVDTYCIHLRNYITPSTMEELSITSAAVATLPLLIPPASTIRLRGV
jgi:hypothetical protein